MDIGVQILSEHEILIVRVGTEIPHPFRLAETLLRDGAGFHDGGELSISASDVLIIDASEYGADLSRPRLEFPMTPGIYNVLTHEYDSANGGLMVLHILRAVSRSLQ